MGVRGRWEPNIHREGQLTREEAPNLLDEKPCALDIFLHLRAAGAHLSLKALGI